jgi:hypothetical protein
VAAVKQADDNQISDLGGEQSGRSDKTLMWGERLKHFVRIVIAKESIVILVQLILCVRDDKEIHHTSDFGE